jgi:hypothetical protein
MAQEAEPTQHYIYDHHYNNPTSSRAYILHPSPSKRLRRRKQLFMRTCLQRSHHEHLLEYGLMRELQRRLGL